MKRVTGILFLVCFSLFGLTGVLIAEEVKKLIIEQDTVISEDTTWTGEVVINEGVTLIVRDATLTIEEGHFTNNGSLIMENAHLAQISKILKRIYNSGVLELRNSTTDFAMYLRNNSSLSAENSEFPRRIFFDGDNVQMRVKDCEIERIRPQGNSILEVVGECKINILDISIHIPPNANVTYINNQFTEESEGYIIPEVSVSPETETKLFGYGMDIGLSSEVTIKDSELFYLGIRGDSEVTLENCKMLPPYGWSLSNRGSALKATNCSFRIIETYRENAISTLTNCIVTDYVRNNKGETHLINTKVADTLYEDKTLNEGERLP